MHFHDLMYICDGIQDKDKEVLIVFEASPNVSSVSDQNCSKETEIQFQSIGYREV